MAAPTFTANGTAAGSTSTMTPAHPASWAVNDILCPLLESCGGEPVGFGTANGFAHVTGSPVQTGTGTAGSTCNVFWVRAVTSQASMITNDPGDHVVGREFGIRGCVTTGNPWSDAPVQYHKAAASTSWTLPAIVTTYTDILVAFCITHDFDTSTAEFSPDATTSTGLTVTVRINGSNGAGNGGGFMLGTCVVPAGGSSGTWSGTTVNSVINSGLVVPFKSTTSTLVAPTSQFFEWNGVTEDPIDLEGEWNGTTVDVVTFDQEHV